MRNYLAFSLLLISACAVTGCGQGGADQEAADAGPRRSGILSRMHPKADAATMEQMRAEEAKNQEEQMRLAQEAAAQGQEVGGSSLNGVGRILPEVSTAPFSEGASATGSTLANPFQPPSGTGSSSSGSGDFSAATITPAQDSGPIAEAPPTMPDAGIATYSSGYMPTSVPPPPPGAVAGGLVPPPPAVTLSTNAQVGYSDPYANPYGGGGNPYANPYLNPYGIPYQQMPPPQQAMPPQEPERPKGLFGSGTSARKSREDPEDEAPKKKEDDFVPIRPTGMEARSAYKQRDDLKTLWNGALSTSAFQRIAARDKNLEGSMKRIAVGLPPGPSKGTFTVPARTVNSIFRPVRLDKKVEADVRKMQIDLVQAYYRYLSAYNKFALQQQTVAARKQEIEVAASRAEKQRAAADLARSTDAADSSREDMRSAQYELAAVAGARAARTIIGRVSGVTPSIGALASAEKSGEPVDLESDGSGSSTGVLGSVGSWIFGGKGSSPKPEKSGDDDRKLAKEETKEKDRKKAKSGSREDDLAPSHVAAVKTPAADPGVPAVAKKPKVPKGPISFELKDVQITARKSVLTVAIRNTGSESFKFSPDVISISEGNRKISEAAMRAEFDSTLVKPNKEVQGKITIFGRPWNDRLGVFISDGKGNIQLQRNHN